MSLDNSWNYPFSPTDGGSLESISSLSSLKSRRILTCRVLPLKADGSPAASSLSYPGKIIIKGTKSSFCALPWSCSSLQSSTFGLSSSVPLIKRWGGAGRGQLWLPHPPAQPSPALLAPLLPHGETPQLCQPGLISVGLKQNYRIPRL